MKRSIAFLIIAALLISTRFTIAETVVGTDVSDFLTTSVITGNVVTGAVFAESEITIVHYFSTFCDNLIAELQYMQRAFSEYAGKVNVLGLLYEDSLSTAEGAAALFEEYGLDYDCVHIDAVFGWIVNTYNYIPQTFIVSNKGIIVEHFPGTLPDYDTLNGMISHWVDAPAEFFKVTFIDGLTGEILGVQSIPYGADAVLPIPPVHEGYVFSYWKGDYTDITGPVDIIAVYEPVPPDTDNPSPEPTPVHYLDGDADGSGRVDVFDVLLVLRYAMGIYHNDIIPLCCDLTGDGSIQIDDALIILRIAMHIQ